MQVGTGHAHERVVEQSRRVAGRGRVDRLAHVADLRHHIFLFFLGLEEVFLWIELDRAGAHLGVKAQCRGLLRAAAHYEMHIGRHPPTNLLKVVGVEHGVEQAPSDAASAVVRRDIDLVEEECTLELSE